jgi:hypothetical protein
MKKAFEVSVGHIMQLIDLVLHLISEKKNREKTIGLESSSRSHLTASFLWTTDL